MTEKDTLLLLTDPEAKKRWEELAHQSLKGRSLEKVLNTKTVEGIEYKGLYIDGECLPDLETYPEGIISSRIYDSAICTEDDLSNDHSEGMQGTVLLVEGKKFKSDFSAKYNPTIIVQKNNDELLDQFKGQESSVYVDTNELNFEKFSEDIERIKSRELGFAINISQTHNAGASAVQEISYGLNIFNALLKSGVKPSSIKFFTAVDSLIFLNMAKLRALRYLAEEVLDAYGLKKEVFILAVTSLREQTLYDPYVNMLRNCSGAMSAIMGGANQMAIRTHDSIFSLLTREPASDQAKRSARNILNIALEESKLAFVMDPGKGSFALEKLSREMASQSWESFLNWEEKDLFNNIKDFSASVEAIAKARYERIRSRKTVVTGVNEYANSDETIQSMYDKPWRPVEVPFGLFPLRRTAYEFEDLRLAFEELDVKPKVCLVRKGPLAKLSGRINFIKNIFETMGLEVVESEEELALEEYFKLAKKEDCSALAFCGLDDEYSQWVKAGDRETFKHQFIAGKKDKFELEDKEQFIDLYMGKNIYSDLALLLGDKNE
ncbi:MAG: hypothetical protein CME64_00265 [Halobacteriovoraceae bacterium]|nr:hypothetical protein [Halobacteriovoraceae bacterium]